jgi:PIN domain nuclease of toxin-antitoxin system
VVAELPQVLISAVNLSEVVGVYQRSGAARQATTAALAALALPVAAHDAELAAEAGFLEVPSRGHGLSLGDRCCLVLAQRERAAVLTTDRRLASFGPTIGVTVELIR